MNPNHTAGKIHKKQFLASALTLFAFAIIAACVRFYARLRVRRQRFGVDDFFLLFGLVCLAVAVGILFRFIDAMYMVTALAFGKKDIYLPPDFIQQVTHFHTWSVVSLELLWIAGCAVKFSFLALFYNLIQRQPRMKRYWWVATCVSFVTTVYGITSYILPCPWFDFERSLQCLNGNQFQRVFIYAAVQMSMDIFSDFMILCIPIRIIWQVQIRRSQKLALSCSLCLTAVMIAVTAMRLVGLRHGNVIDCLWETYWQFMAAEVGLILTAATALRTLFVARAPSPLVAAAAAQKNGKLHHDSPKIDHHDGGVGDKHQRQPARLHDAGGRRDGDGDGDGVGGSVGGSGGGGGVGVGRGDVLTQSASSATAVASVDAEQEEAPKGGWRRQLRRHKSRRAARAMGYQLPHNVPRATMTGMWTFIQGGRRHSLTSGGSSTIDADMSTADDASAATESGSGSS